MDSDARHSGFFGASIHLPVEITLGDGKHSVICSNAVEHFEVIPNFLCQKLRHSDDTIALFRLWSGNQILPIQPLIGFVDGDSSLLKVKIRWGQSQQLPLPDTAPVEHLKGVEGQRLVHHHLGKFQVLLLGPEHHLSVFLFPHAACLFTRVITEIVIPYCMVKDCTELIVNRLKIHR